MQVIKNNARSKQIPQWMCCNTQVVSTKKPRSGFIQKTLTGLSRILQNDLLSERYASKNGLLQSLHPSVKLITLLSYMVLAGISQSMLILLLLALLSFCLARLSLLNLKDYIIRVWLIFPVITLLLSLPAATNLLIPGDPVVYIFNDIDWRIPGTDNMNQLFFSLQGIKAIVKMSVRIGASFSFGYLLAVTTHWSALTKALHSIKVPKTVVMLLDMTYRFIFILVKASIEIFEARFLRTVGRVCNKKSRNFVSSSIAALFIKASQMGDETFNAMVCRGYTGEPVSCYSRKISKGDIIWAINTLIIALFLLYGELIYG